ncbi:MAG: DUF1553 domain-containing protein [Planctomycetes bacterium]|nr:DUF1553 domain-containing protein [Planctomycetota bacterium]
MPTCRNNIGCRHGSVAVVLSAWNMFARVAAGLVAAAAIAPGLVAWAFEPPVPPASLTGVETRMAQVARVEDGAFPRIESLRAAPLRIDLHPNNRRQQVVFAATDAQGTTFDCTDLVTLASLNRDVARVEGTTMVAAGDGETQLHAALGSTTIVVPVRVTEFARRPTVHFENDVTPIFSKLGCNSGGCHGRAAGQNGFKLSVFAFDPQADYDALTKEGRGRRIFPAQPDRSLLLTKPTGGVPHGGGQRMAPDSSDHLLMLEWIRQGMPWGSSDAPRLIGLRVEPQERVIHVGGRMRILATAIYSDGRERDVTAAAAYASNASQLAEVDAQGRVQVGLTPGQATITVAYMGQVGAVRLLMPRADSVATERPRIEGRSAIDQQVTARLRLLGIPASPGADDPTFLRRVTVDIAGRLPTPAEVRRFLADGRPDKRERWVNDLLESGEFADIWALKLADILLVDRRKLGERGAYELHRWLREQLARHRPYDELVRDLITGSGNSARSGPANLFRTVENAEGLARLISQAFLGVRLECAQCHHHPFERWSQDDFYGLAAFFQGLERQPIGADRVLVYHAGVRETRIPNSQRVIAPHVLDGPPIDRYAGDIRVALADWLVAPSNPWFAELIANRLWKQMFGRGLVEPEDDLRTTNPASNPELLRYLSERVAATRYDLRAVLREIAVSDTYQASSQTVAGNADDEQNFSHYYPRRLNAEILLDAISDVTGIPEPFPGRAPSTRAVQLWDNRLPNYFLEIFGRPERTSPCECGRSNEPTMAQALHLMNAPEVESRLVAPGSRVDRLLAAGAAAGEIVEELSLAAVGRPPNSQERQIGLELFAASPPRDAAADFLWTLLNSPDFLLNH